MKRTLAIPVLSKYLVKRECLLKAKNILFHNEIDMKLEPLAEEIFAHTVLYYIAKFLNWKWLLLHANPIDLEDGGDKPHRKIIYKIIWIIIPSR